MCILVVESVKASVFPWITFCMRCATTSRLVSSPSQLWFDFPTDTQYFRIRTHQLHSSSCYFPVKAINLQHHSIPPSSFFCVFLSQGNCWSSLHHRDPGQHVPWHYQRSADSVRYLQVQPRVRCTRTYIVFKLWKCNYMYIGIIHLWACLKL